MRSVLAWRQLVTGPAGDMKAAARPPTMPPAGTPAPSVGIDRKRHGWFVKVVIMDGLRVLNQNI